MNERSLAKSWDNTKPNLLVSTSKYRSLSVISSYLLLYFTHILLTFLLKHFRHFPGDLSGVRMEASGSSAPGRARSLVLGDQEANVMSPDSLITQVPCHAICHVYHVTCHV